MRRILWLPAVCVAAVCAAPETHVFKRSDGSAAGISMPIFRRDEGSAADRVVSPEWIQRETHKLRAKYRIKDRREKRQAAALADYSMDSFYFATVNIGTPPQAFNLVLDTGSSDTWVVSSACPPAQCTHNVHKFDTSKSHTFHASDQPFHVSYGTGGINKGRLVSDTVSIANFTVASLTFAEALDISEHTVQPPASGIMGLGFESLATSGATPLWQVLMIEKKVEERVFSFQLKNNMREARNGQDIRPGGIFTLGMLDKSQFQGDINWVSVPKKFGNTGIGYWAVPLDRIQVNSRSFPPGANPYAVIDTGTTLIGGPPDVVRAIYSAIPGARPSQVGEGYYEFPCNAHFTIKFGFGGRDYEITRENINLGSQGIGSMCVGAIFAQQTGPHMPGWIVGDSFLKTVFSAFRYEPQAVGFAQLNAHGAETLPLDRVNTQSVSEKPGNAVSTAPGGGGGGGGPHTITRGAEPTGLQGGKGLPTPSVVSTPSHMSIPARSAADTVRVSMALVGGALVLGALLW